MFSQTQETVLGSGTFEAGDEGVLRLVGPAIAAQRPMKLSPEPMRCRLTR